MRAARTTVVIELGFKPLAISLERPSISIFPDWESFRRGLYSYAVTVMNERTLNRDECATLARLGDPGEWVQRILTNNRELCWQGDDTGVPTSLRKPITDQGWYLVLRDAGLEPVRKVVNAYLSLFPDAPR